MTKPKEPKLDKPLKYVEERFGRAMKKLGEEQSWEKEFDEKFPILEAKDFCKHCEHEQTWVTMNKRKELKSFITSLLSQRDKELVKLIRVMQEEGRRGEGWTQDGMRMYERFEAVIKIIQEKK